MQAAKSTNALHPVLTVSQLTAQVRELLETVFENVYVVGEVSNAKAYTSGHWYFSLKDKEATLSCVCFKSANQGVKFRLDDGLMVVARGRLAVYPPKGGYQLVVNSLEPVGVGEWQLAFDQLKSKLEKEGLLDPARKRPIPTLPRRIGVVTSPVGAAVADVLSALKRRNKNVSVVIAPAKVQGEGSAEEVAQAIEWLHQVPNIDVIIVARGGGSIEDLWSFNTETVARAIASSAIPVISGVGHETDVTIADLVADLRAPTPTAAAELVAKGSAEILLKWSYLEKQLFLRTQAHLHEARRRLDKASPAYAVLRYEERLKRDRMRIANYKERLERLSTHILAGHQHRWHKNHEKLTALSPLNVLARGFTILKKEDGSVVRDWKEVQPGEALQAWLMNGILELSVENALARTEESHASAQSIEVVPTPGSNQSEMLSPDPDEQTQTDHAELGEVDTEALMQYCAVQFSAKSVFTRGRTPCATVDDAHAALEERDLNQVSQSNSKDIPVPTAAPGSSSSRTKPARSTKRGWSPAPNESAADRPVQLTIDSLT